jgi:hypothetical protein
LTVIMRDAGHALNAERPDEVAEWYLAFLEALNYRGGMEGLHRAAMEARTSSLAPQPGSNSSAGASSIKDGPPPSALERTAAGSSRRFLLEQAAQGGSVSSELGIVDETDAQGQKVLSVNQNGSINTLPVVRSSSLKGGAAFPPLRLDSFSSMHQAAAPMPAAPVPPREEQKKSYHLGPASPSIVEHPSPSPSPVMDKKDWQEQLSLGGAGGQDEPLHHDSQRDREQGATQQYEQTSTIQPSPELQSPQWHEDKEIAEEEPSKKDSTRRDEKQSRKHDSALREEPFEQV